MALVGVRISLLRSVEGRVGFSSDSPDSSVIGVFVGSMDVTAVFVTLTCFVPAGVDIGRGIEVAATSVEVGSTVHVGVTD